MSSGCECSFIEVRKGGWYYLLEDFDAPKNAWDWRDNASAYGPFASLVLAEKHLDENHSNPGGSCVSELPDGQDALDINCDSTLKRLIDNAIAPRKNAFSARW